MSSMRANASWTVASLDTVQIGRWLLRTSCWTLFIGYCAATENGQGAVGSQTGSPKKAYQGAITKIP